MEKELDTKVMQGLLGFRSALESQGDLVSRVMRGRTWDIIRRIGVITNLLHPPGPPSNHLLVVSRE